MRGHTDAFEPADLPLIEKYCARLGGWTGDHGKPGPAVMLAGCLEIRSAKRALAVMGDKADAQIR